MPPTTCDPTCRRYSCAHVFLRGRKRQSRQSPSERERRYSSLRQWLMIRTYVSVRFPLSQVDGQSRSTLLSDLRPPAEHLPMLVALRMLMARSASVLCDWSYSGALRRNRCWVVPAYRLMVAVTARRRWIQGELST